MFSPQQTHSVSRGTKFAHSSFLSDSIPERKVRKQGPSWSQKSLLIFGPVLGERLRKGEGCHESSRSWGEGPIATAVVALYRAPMNILLLLLVLFLLFGGGGFYFGGPVFGGGAIGLILLILLIVYLSGGLRSKNSSN